MVKKLIPNYKKGSILKFYKSDDFERQKIAASFISPPGQSVGDAALDTDEIVPYDQEKIIQEFMQKKITNRIGIENIILTRWFLKDYLKNIKCSAFLISYQYEINK